MDTPMTVALFFSIGWIIGGVNAINSDTIQIKEELSSLREEMKESAVHMCTYEENDDEL